MEVCRTIKAALRGPFTLLGAGLFFWLFGAVAALAQLNDIPMTPTCSNSSLWNSYIGGTFSPQPACKLSEFRPTINIPFPSVTGIADHNNDNKIVNDQAHIQFAQGLIQAQTERGFDRQESAFAINFISNTGGGAHPTPSGQDYSAKVALYVSCLMLKKAANTWCENLDLVIGSGVGAQSAYLRESDISNFNGPYTPGLTGGLGNAVGDFKTFHGFPLTSAELWSNDAPKGDVTMALSLGSRVAKTTSGICSVGDEVSGIGVPPHTYVESINGVRTAVNSSGLVQLSNSAQASTISQLRRTTFNLFNGFILDGPSLIRDSTFVDGSDSRNFLKAYGNHTAIIDSTEARLQFIWLSSQGQKGCFNVFDACFSYTGNGRLAFSENGGTPFSIVGVPAGVNGVMIKSAKAGHGAVISPMSGGDATIPLNLSGLNAPVNIDGNEGLVVHGNIEAGRLRSTLFTPKSGSACKPGEFVDDTNYHYVCVESHRWKRAALTDF